MRAAGRSLTFPQPLVAAPPPVSIGLAARGVSLRPAAASDEGFLRALYASFRAEELAPVPWSPEQKAAFLAEQFALQHHHFTTRLEGVTFWVIERHVAGRAPAPIGRLYLQRTAAAWLIVDIGVMPEARGGGLGTELIHWIQHQARAAGAQAVELSVARNNPRAARLYARLGFAFTDGASEMHRQMRWSAA